MYCHTIHTHIGSTYTTHIYTDIHTRHANIQMLHIGIQTTVIYNIILTTHRHPHTQHTQIHLHTHTHISFSCTHRHMHTP